MSYDRHPITAAARIPAGVDEAVPAYCATPVPAAPARSAEQSPIEQMFAYYDAA